VSRKSRVLLSVLLALCLVVVTLVSASPAAAKSLSWDRWDSEIWINKDGTFTVRETYEIYFIGGPFRFGYRNIPINQFTGISDVSVSENGVDYAESQSESANTFYWVEEDGQYLINWYFPSTSDQSRTFDIQYTVAGGLIINEEVGDRFFWKAVGPEHAFPIVSSTTTVHVPPGTTVDPEIDPFYSGAEAIYFFSDDKTAVTYRAANIPEDQYFEVGVRFPHGFVPNVIPPWQAAYEEEQNWNEQSRPIANLALAGIGIFLLIASVVGVYVVWLLSGRDPDVGPVPEYLTEPPSDLPPGLAGTLVDESADLQDIMATLVDLARRGVVDMEEHDKRLFGISVSKTFTFHKRGDFSGNLRGYESILVRELFGSGMSKDLDDLKDRFYSAVPKIQDALYKEAVKEGLFPVSPKSVRARYLGLGIVGIIISAALFVCVGAAFIDRVDTLLCPFVALGVGSLALIGVSSRMPAKSRKGAEENAKWKAFRVYLERADKIRDVGEAATQFEKYLPYAIAFGLERSWINKFARVPDVPMPRWYYPVGVPYYVGHPRTFGSQASEGTASVGGASHDLSGSAVKSTPSLDSMSGRVMGGLNSMSAGLFTMLNSTASAFTSVPHSSGSGGGGFSGGGFSGGGGGGGGGAGFG